MKKRILTYITALVILPFLHSCDETDEMRQPEPFDSWQNGATLKFAPKADATGETQVSFEYKIDKKNPSNNGWSRTELNYDLSFASEGGDVSDISKIEVYAFLEENLGDGYNYIGGETGKLLTTITQPTASSLFKITTDQLSELFKNDFSGNRTELSEEDFVEIKWVITGKDGKVFDSSYPRKKPIEFPLGQGNVIEGWDEGIALLKVGDKARFVIPSHLGYGSRGAGGVIPPNATLIFDVELMDVK